MHVQEYLGVELFELEAGVVSDPVVELQGLVPAAADAVFEQLSRLGQRVLTSGGDLGDGLAFASQRDHVPGVGEFQRGPVLVVPDLGLGSHVEQFRMHRSSEEVKHQFAGVGADRRE